jgi:hypothetical protein
MMISHRKSGSIASTRAEILIAVTEMDLAKKRTSGDPPLQ